MHIGFLTNCFRERALPDIIQWAGANGFTALELAAWPRKPEGVDPSLDVVNFDQQKANDLNALAKHNNLTFTCLTFCGNTLAHDPEERQANVLHLKHVIEAANLLGVDTISTFIGRDQTKTQAENFDEMVAVFVPLVEYAAARNVRIAIENCPMPGWQFEGLPGNLAYSPNIWDQMFTRIPHPNFGLNLDPSHLIWLGVDPYQAATKYASRVFHTHAKDTVVYVDKRDSYSIADNGWGTWWQYRMPGKGDLDWTYWVSTLRSIGYDAVLSIEHEDPEYEHTQALVQEGLVLGRKNLTEAIERAS